MRRTLFAAAIVSMVAAGGCHASEDDTEPNFTPKTVAFDGKVDDRYVGDWTSKDGSSTLNLAKDGTLKLGITSKSQNGKSTSQYGGHWLVNGSDLKLRYGEGTAQATTLSYMAALSGNSMTLQQSGGKIKTVYSRK